MTDQTPPEGFSLDAEASRQDDAAQAGIVARDNEIENDAQSPVNGVPGDATGGDDDAIEDAADREPLGDI
jgi:hypothetical protein